MVRIYVFVSSVRSLCIALLLDSRNIPAPGRVGDPDDIIGSVLVKDSKVGLVYLV